MTSGYTPLFNEIVTSSIWNEDNAVRIVWITLMALSDMDGNVQASIAGLAPVARVSLTECEKAIEILSSPDQYSRSQEKEGRRIEPIDGGWHLVNHKKYRQKAKSRAGYMRRYRQEKKKNQKEKNNTNPHPNSETQCNITLPSVTITRFDVFWKAYPKKISEETAKMAFLEINPSEQLLEIMLLAIEQQNKSEQWNRERPRYIPNPANWLNEKRWNDELSDISDNIPFDNEAAIQREKMLAEEE